MDRLNADKYYATLTTAAQGLIAAEKSGERIPRKFNFNVQEVCAACHENILPPRKVMRCGGCRSAIYCSKECQARSWTTPVQPRAPTHRQLCRDNQRHMQRLPQTQAIIKLFPWGRIEKDGSFNTDIARGRFKVLGRTGYGYWSHRGGPVPHQETGPFETRMAYAQQLGSLLKSFDHLDGKDLTKGTHLTDKEGWKLPNHLIPYRDFSATGAKMPQLVTELPEPIEGWESWYRWRKLPLESPVALIMHTALTIYQLLVNCLEVTSPKAGKEDKRVPLHVHLIGAEVELNYLPTLSELALLLPYHDIKLVLFGAGVTRLLTETSRFKSALANKSTVFEYAAPAELGSGSISIHLHNDSPLWSTSGPNNAMSKYSSPPDAIVACNAGLGSYPQWMPVIRDVHRFGIPFATTEYAEQSAEAQKGNMGLIVAGFGRQRAEDEYSIDLNPFQKPGQRALPMYRLPNVCNGFTLVVWKRDRKADQLKGEGEGVEKNMGALGIDDLD